MRRTIITNAIICTLAPYLYSLLAPVSLAYGGVSYYLLANLGLIWVALRSHTIANYWLYLWYVIDGEEEEFRNGL
jgi:hypothetical protein